MDAWTRIFWFQNIQYKHSWLIYFKRNSNYIFPNWFYQWWDFFGPIPEILPSPTDEGYKLFQSKFDIQETCVPAMLKFFSIFSLSWVFSWQYQYGKSESDHPKALPILQRHAYVKWWSQFDSSMAYPEKVREWFKNNPKNLKISNPETASSMITAASTTDPAMEIRSGAPFFGGEEPGAPTGGKPMEGPPTEVGTEAELGALEGEAGGAGVVLKKHDAWKTSGDRRQNGDGRRQTGRRHGQRQSVTGSGRASRVKTKQTNTPRATAQRAKTNWTTKRKMGRSTGAGQVVATRLCSCECEG
ncbi:hypothetical protein PIB30_088249 [Stylosanthes scabra]|uniref:Aminotransferase-like plant mobile domain-containing protein n=1 Tax=Stylosanthes scabra TaxID=79078 RepID=A0ABU6TUB8_9FABA|nr:hypothetical protein [Stylosanthes scabra]